MIARASKLAALLLGVAFAAIAAGAQENDSAPADERAASSNAEAPGRAERPGGAAEADPLSATPVDEEEVVVRGRLSRGALRVQIEMAEEAFYNRFNDINSDDEFDIHCRSVVELGSRIPRRRCEPNFWRTAKAQFAQDTVIELQGGFAGIPEAALARANHLGLELDKEIRELAANDPLLLEALARLATLRQAYSARGEN